MRIASLWLYPPISILVSFNAFQCILAPCVVVVFNSGLVQGFRRLSIWIQGQGPRIAEWKSEPAVKTVIRTSHNRTLPSANLAIQSAHSPAMALSTWTHATACAVVAFYILEISSVSDQLLFSPIQRTTKFALWVALFLIRYVEHGLSVTYAAHCTGLGTAPALAIANRWRG